MNKPTTPAAADALMKIFGLQRSVNHYFCMNGPYEGCLATVVGNHSQGRVLLSDQQNGNVKAIYELLDGRLWWDE